MSVTEAPPADELRRRASELVPVLRESAAETERARRVPDEHFEALAEVGILRMMAPKRYGGAEADFQTQVDVLAELARGCPSTSWVATISSALAWVAALFPDEAQEEVFASRDPRVSGVFAATGRGVRADGGLRISGRWAFNTGCHGSRWTYLNLIVEEGEGVPMSVLVPSRELTILDDWYATGMAGTGSNTVVADDLFVPEHRTLPLSAELEAAYPERHNSDNPYFNLPVVPVLTVNAGGTPVGIARGALDAFLERLPGRAIAYTDYTVQAEAPLTHLQVGEASLKIDSADAHLRRAAALLDRHRSGPLSTAERVESRVRIGYATGLAREAVDTLFRASGATAIQPHVPIQRFQRDVQALSNHGIMQPTTSIELYGRVLCGLPPNTTLL